MARHEFGHGIGLRHVLNETDLMYPTQAPNFCNVIHTDDADGGEYELLNVAPFITQAGLTPNPKQTISGCPGPMLNGIENMETSPYNIIVYPNPFDQSVTVNADIASPSDVKIELINIMGQLIYTENYDIISGSQFQKSIPTGNITNGIYLLKVSVNNSTAVFKLVKN